MNHYLCWLRPNDKREKEKCEMFNEYLYILHIVCKFVINYASTDRLGITYISSQAMCASGNLERRNVTFQQLLFGSVEPHQEMSFDQTGLF